MASEDLDPHQSECVRDVDCRPVAWSPSASSTARVARVGFVLGRIACMQCVRAAICYTRRT